MPCASNRSFSESGIDVSPIWVDTGIAAKQAVVSCSQIVALAVIWQSLDTQAANHERPVANAFSA
jgi:hypothetical protein